jgi:1-aminocyclopropane-1-carboxylate deaminase/D-cysteine desulfhydrase-like pyridoxal-dependent ACC family enzyme
LIVNQLQDNIFEKYSIKVFLLRLDLMHLPIGGNKFFKLKYNLEEAQKLAHNKLLTFGGAYSNHLKATAIAGQVFGFQTIGLVRGDEIKELNPILTFCQNAGMELSFIDRTNYRLKSQVDFIEKLKEKFGNFYLIPEGGSNALAVKGAKEILSEIPFSFDYVMTACGTGGTLAGLICGLKENQKALGISVLKGGHFLNAEVENLLLTYETQFSAQIPRNFEILPSYHFGGYAKKTPDLEAFIQNFQTTQQIPIEWIYTGKMLYALYDLVQKNYFPEHSTIIALHTGGVN